MSQKRVSVAQSVNDVNASINVISSLVNQIKTSAEETESSNEELSKRFSVYTLVYAFVSNFIIALGFLWTLCRSAL